MPVGRAHFSALKGRQMRANETQTLTDANVPVAGFLRPGSA